MYKILNGLSAPYLACLFKDYNVSTVRELRSATHNLLNVPRAIHQYGFKAFRCSGARIWNSLPSDIKECNTLTKFKNLCKTHIFSQM